MKDRLPFTDENLEDVAYRDECDRLSELEVQDCYSSWGRWFLDDGMLCTWVCNPSTEGLPVMALYVYSIGIEKCDSVGKQAEVLKEMQQKSWIGSAGLKSLQRAFKYLAKKSTTVA